VLRVARVRRGGPHGREAAVRSCGDAGCREREQHGEDKVRQLAAHPPGIL
jgi:hypothetical protein